MKEDQDTFSGWLGQVIEFTVDSSNPTLSPNANTEPTTSQTSENKQFWRTYTQKLSTNTTDIGHSLYDYKIYQQHLIQLIIILIKGGGPFDLKSFQGGDELQLTTSF